MSDQNSNPSVWLQSLSPRPSTNVKQVSPPRTRCPKNLSRADLQDPREGIPSQWAGPGAAMCADEEAEEGNQ